MMEVATQPLLPDLAIRQPGGSKRPAFDREPLKIQAKQAELLLREKDTWIWA